MEVPKEEILKFWLKKRPEA